MVTKEIIKILCLFGLFVGLAPVLAWAMKGRRAWQRVAFFVMCFMTIGGFLGPASWGLTLQSVEFYRGHARGFHFYFNDVLAVALILAHCFERRSDFRWVPPGLWLYLAWCGVCFLSLASAPGPGYVLMAGFKSVKMSLFFVAAYNFLRGERDLRFFLYTMGVVATWEMVVVLIHKYIQGSFQIRGTFEHQNSLAMYFGMIGMVFLALSLGHAREGLRRFFCWYLACALIVVSSLSRGGLAVFALGSMGVVVLSLMERVTPRRLLVVGLLSLMGTLGLAKAMDALVARFTMPQNVVAGQGRTVLKRCAREMFRDYPWGIGWNNFALVMNRPFRYGAAYDTWTLARGYSVDHSIPKPVVESLYWLFLAETGIQSLLVYLALMGLFLWWNLRSAWFFRHGFVGAVSLGIALGCGINYLHSFLERVLVFEKNMMLWMLLLAATARIEAWRRIASRSRAVRRSLAELGDGPPHSRPPFRPAPGPVPMTGPLSARSER
jgi:hypothetical protein